MRSQKPRRLNPQPALRIPHFPHGGDVYAFARSLGVSPGQVLDFSASINPLGWPPGAAAAYRWARARVGAYPEPYAETLTAELAGIHRLDPSAVLVGNGSTQLIHLVARVLAAKRVLLVAPLFSEHAAAFRLAGAHVDHFLLRPPTFTLSPEQLGTVLTRGYETVVLTNPSNPTGVLVPRPEVEAIAECCRRAGATLLVDEAFVDWVEEASVERRAAMRPGVVVLRSLTKFFALPGLRVGYCVAHPRLVRRLRDRIEPWSVNSVAQEVARACLRNRRFAERSRTFLAAERVWMFEQLCTIDHLQPVPSQANFFLLRLRTEGYSAADLARALARQRIVIRVCDNFVGLGKRYFRVAVRTRAENRRLLVALRGILGYLGRRPPVGARTRRRAR